MVVLRVKMSKFLALCDGEDCLQDHHPSPTLALHLQRSAEREAASEERAGPNVRDGEAVTAR